MSFRWTPARDRALRENVRDGFTLKEAATMIGCGCTREDAAARIRALREQDRAADLTAVPRPPAPPPNGRTLIDLSRAPSSMEQAAAGWRGR